ncbi:MAG: PEP-CTERM sorting domain-containing protein [Verrucomicrobiota bacterium]
MMKPLTQLIASRSRSILPSGACFLAIAVISSGPAFGIIEVEGSFDPTDASFWINGGNSATSGILGTAAGNSTLDVDGGSLLALDELITSDDGAATSTVTVTGSNSRINTTANISIGEFGVGNLTVSAGGSVEGEEIKSSNWLGSEGTIRVTGAGSTLTARSRLIIGEEALGRLEILDGGVVNTLELAVSNLAQSEGHVTVSGNGSQLNATDESNFASEDDATLTISDGGEATFDAPVFFGRNGDMEVLVESGGRLQVGSLLAAQGSGSDVGVTVTGSGSEFIIDADATFSDDGNSTVLISDGGRLQAGSLLTSFFTPGEAVVTVTGSGSQLIVDTDFTLSDDGTSFLNILDGGLVDVAGELRAAAFLDSSEATINVDGAGSELEADLLVIAHTGSTFLNVTNGGTIDVAGEIIVGGDGETGIGFVNVSGGSLVRSGLDTLIGDSPDTVGTATVTGAGTRWEAGQLWVGTAGDGTLNLLDGAEMSVTGPSRLAFEVGSAAQVNVRGSGTVWRGTGSDGELLIAQGGAATVNVSQGARINMDQSIRVFSNGTMNLLVDGNNMVTAGNSEDFVNNGTVNLLAGAELASGTYAPISAGGGLSGAGTFQGVGGTWNASTNEFEVSAITSDTSGDLGGRRVRYAPDLVVGFSEGVGAETFEATALDVTSIDGQDVLIAYDFETTMPDQLTVLSFQIGSGIDDSLLNIWFQADGSTIWSAFTPVIQAYDGDQFSFGVTQFSSYAVTVVPEPATTWLIALGAALTLLRRRRRG